MAFPVRGNMDENAFKADIIDHYWTGELQNLINASKDTPAGTGAKAGSLVDDYCKIGAFLTKRTAVLTALVPLEKKLRATLETMAPGLKSFNPDAPAHIKANKLLSKALGDCELELGFNNPSLYYGTSDPAKLHTVAYAAQRGTASNTVVTKDNLPQLEKVGMQGKAPLPKGSAVAMGNVAGRDFNRILLRHGYHFKDVGAGSDHGEYTHRLHWSAIANAELGLANSLPYLYRCLGSLWAAGRTNTGTTIIEQKSVAQTVYLWEAIFDCFPSETIARQQKSLAYSEHGVFNCPDYLNLELSKLENLKKITLLEREKPESLWYLRVLLYTRREKRAREALSQTTSYFDKVATKAGGGQKNFAEAYASEPKEGERAGLQGMLIWYLSNSA